MKISFGSVELAAPAMNAAGTCKTLDDIKALASSETAAIVVGSITTAPRALNPGGGWRSQGDYTLNSMGMPNGGAEFYAKHLPEMIQVAHASEKPFGLNVAGFHVQEYIDLVQISAASGADWVELNLGCPNAWDGGKQKSIASFEPQLINEILERIKKIEHPTITVKLSPFSDFILLSKVADILSKSGIVSAVVSTNTFPNTLMYDDAMQPIVDVGQGLAGLSGLALKPISLGQVKQLRNLLLKEIAIIGVGGITTKQDVLEYQKAGAAAVQIATAYLTNGPQIFEVLNDKRS